ncbi:hypothetical protein IAU59_004773 [Kwoniella sp. CBS 9459]
MDGHPSHGYSARGQFAATKTNPKRSAAAESPSSSSSPSSSTPMKRKNEEAGSLTKNNTKANENEQEGKRDEDCTCGSVSRLGRQNRRMHIACKTSGPPRMCSSCVRKRWEASQEIEPKKPRAQTQKSDSASDTKPSVHEESNRGSNKDGSDTHDDFLDRLLNDVRRLESDHRKDSQSPSDMDYWQPFIALLEYIKHTQDRLANYEQVNSELTEKVKRLACESEEYHLEAKEDRQELRAVRETKRVLKEDFDRLDGIAKAHKTANARLVETNSELSVQLEQAKHNTQKVYSELEDVRHSRCLLLNKYRKTPQGKKDTLTMSDLDQLGRSRKTQE